MHIGATVKRILLILALTSTLVSSPGAQSISTPVPVGKSAPAVKTAVAAKPAADIASKILANGLEIVVLEDHSVPIVTIELAVRNGSFTEPPELNGLSHLYEHMFFKANRDVANQEDTMQKIGQLGISS